MALRGAASLTLGFSTQPFQGTEETDHVLCRSSRDRILKEGDEVLEDAQAGRLTLLRVKLR